MTTILIKKRDTAGVPASGDLTNSAGGTEIAVNTADLKIYTKNGGGSIVQIGSGPSATDTLTNKSISGSTNTLTNIGNASLVNSSLTVNGTSISLGGSGTITAVAPNALTIGTGLTGTSYNGSAAVTIAIDSTVVTLSGTQTLTNKTISGGSIEGATIGAVTPSTGAFTTLTASADSAFTSTGALTISKGNTSQRPSPVSGMLRFNTQTTEFEGYNGTAWASVGGAAIVNDTTTASNLFPLFANATTGTAATVFTGNARLLYKPSTGELQSSVLSASNGLMVNSATVTENYTIPNGSNAMSSGPITVNSGVAVTVPSGSRWVVL